MRLPTIYHVRVHRGWGMIATTASPGQRTLTIAAEKAPPGAMAVVVIRSWKTGAEVK
jgi:hypothetical protein